MNEHNIAQDWEATGKKTLFAFCNSIPLQLKLFCETIWDLLENIKAQTEPSSTRDEKQVRDNAMSPF